MSTEEKIERKFQKPLWFEINKAEFDELINDIYNNHENKDFKLTIKGGNYNLIKAKEFWTEVTTRKTSKSEAKKLYEESIQKETNALKDEKSNNVKKAQNSKYSWKFRLSIYCRHLFTQQRGA